MNEFLYMRVYLLYLCVGVFACHGLIQKFPENHYPPERWHQTVNEWTHEGCLQFIAAFLFWKHHFFHLNGLRCQQLVVVSNRVYTYLAAVCVSVLIVPVWVLSLSLCECVCVSCEEDCCSTGCWWGPLFQVKATNTVQSNNNNPDHFPHTYCGLSHYSPAIAVPFLPTSNLAFYLPAPLVKTQISRLNKIKLGW